MVKTDGAHASARVLVSWSGKESRHLSLSLNSCSQWLRPAVARSRDGGTIALSRAVSHGILSMKSFGGLGAYLQISGNH